MDAVIFILWAYYSIPNGPTLPMPVQAYEQEAACHRAIEVIKYDMAKQDAKIPVKFVCEARANL